MRFTLSSALALTCLMSIAVVRPVDRACFGQEKAENAALDPKNADADFEFQGEYSGEITLSGNKSKLGVQIVAEGGGRFFAIGYLHGLPGDGWTAGGETRRITGGQLKDGEVKLSGEADLKIKNGILTIHDEGSQIGECKKVIRKSSTLGAVPPAGAVVLFDGKSADQFAGMPAKEQLLDGDLLVQGVMSKQKFQNFTVHLEFLLSYMPKAMGQQRANSGCYCQGRYEVQILDSFGLSGENHECGGIYSVKSPDLNMCFPPLSWQTYDIDFTAAKFDAEGKKTANARMTVKHNGVVIHRDVEVPKATTAAPLKEGTEGGPIYLQDHGNPIRFRNIWVVEKNLP